VVQQITVVIDDLHRVAAIDGEGPVVERASLLGDHVARRLLCGPGDAAEQDHESERKSGAQPRAPEPYIHALTLHHSRPQLDQIRSLQGKFAAFG